MQKLFKNIHTVFLVCFGCVFSYILINTLFNKKINHFNSYAIIFVVIFAISLLCLFYMIFKRHILFLEKNYNLILAISVCIMFCIQLIFSIVLRFSPIFDFEAVFGSAIQWVDTGTFSDYFKGTSYPNYFYIFPNNLGAVAFQAFFISIARFLGVSDLFLFMSGINSLLICSTIMLTSFICKKLFGICEALLVVVMFFICVPFYFAGAVFYTDFLTILFPVLVLFLFLKSEQTENPKSKIAYYISIAIFCSLGILIKFTVIIAVIAIFLFLFINRSFKKSFVFAICNIAVIALVCTVFNTYMYNVHLTDKILQQERLPYAHWMMMGVNPWGDYDGNDEVFTRSFNSYPKKSQACTTEALHRIKTYGIKGMVKLYTLKSVRCFGDGTLGLSDFLDDNPAHITPLHQLILYDGIGYKTYKLVTSGIFASFILLMVLSAFANAKKTFCKKTINSIVHISIFGLLLFLLIWEAKNRYITNFIPYIFIAATSFFPIAYQKLEKYITP